jgi:hypothetical protein
MEKGTPEEVPVIQEAREEDLELLPELVTHLRDRRTELREQWANRITKAHLLAAMTDEEIFSMATSVYDSYVEVLETGSVEALQAYARDLSERIIPRGVETYEVVGIVLLLRDVLARSLFEKYQKDFELLNRVLDAYEPAANRIANTVAVSFVQERERIIRQQQDAIRELSTPVLQIRERILILPIIGVLDEQRANQFTEQLLAGIRSHRAEYRPDHVQTLLGRKQRLFAGVDPDGDDQAVAKADGVLDDVQMTVGDGIKRAGIERDTGHKPPLPRPGRPGKVPTWAGFLFVIGQ